jgi:hypothetical protein
LAASLVLCPLGYWAAGLRILLSGFGAQHSLRPVISLLREILNDLFEGVSQSRSAIVCETAKRGVKMCSHLAT